ncbi:DUF5677 domain-containing protein [Lentzea sp. NPDC006480]|uniref:DUF5677 domain-containing protein n=1 Tax=Lentzea sp. NPDC006480 TaxID=3157176 RepID=UPI0033AD62EA
MADRAPWFGFLYHNALIAGQPFISGFLNKGDVHRAASVVFNQASSDFINLWSELADGNGRSAVRTARSLIEHAVNMADVVSNSSRAERYMDHLGFAAEFLNEFELGLDTLKRSERRKAKEQRRHGLRKVASQLVGHLGRYGKGFRASWSEMNLKDRTVKFQLDEFYPAYRLCSLFIHGASGGELGLSRQIGDQRVIRTGPAIHLCPFAYITGIRAMQEVLKQASIVEPTLDSSPFSDALENLAKAWPLYVEVMNKIDREIWPDTPPPPPMTVLAIAQNGTQRWYWHNPVAQALIEAEPPELEEKFRRSVDEITQEVKRNPGRFFSNDRRFATVTFFDHVRVVPKRDGRMVHASAILLRPHEHQHIRWDQFGQSGD